MRRINRKRSSFYTLAILILFLSIGFAIYSVTLRLNGGFGIKSTNVKVEWRNPYTTEGSVPGEVSIDSETKTIASVTASLTQPSDYHEFTIDAVNLGNVDAMLNVLDIKAFQTINGEEEEIDIPEYIKVTFKYADGHEVKKFHVIEAGRTETYLFRIEFDADKIDENNRPTENTSIRFEIDPDYTYADDKSEEIRTFSEDSWETIVNNVKNNTIPYYYKVGMEKSVILTYDFDNDGVAEEKEFNLRIANRSNDNECLDSTTSKTACGFVLEFVDIIDTDHSATDIRTYLNTDIYNALPDVLKNAIIDTKVVSGHGSTSQNDIVTLDKIYLLSTKEIFGNLFEEEINDTAKNRTRRLDYYSKSNKESYFRKTNGIAYNYLPWFTRTINSTTASYYYTVTYEGKFSWASRSGVSPAFRIDRDASTLARATFNANGGETPTEYIDVIEGETIGKLPEPTREGYGFLGWYTDVNDGVKIDSDTVVASDTTYYAHWDKDRIVTFVGNGGKFSNNVKNLDIPFRHSIITTKYSHTPNINDSGVASGVYSSNLSRNDVVTIPGAEQLEIEVWYSTQGTSYDWLAIYPAGVTPTSSNYSEATISGGKVGGGSSTLKPDDTSNNHKTYIVDGDTAQFYFKSNGSNNYYGYYAIIKSYSEGYYPIVSYEQPVRSHYTFKNWNTSQDGSGTTYTSFDEIAELVPTYGENTKIYAQWNDSGDARYIVTLDPNGGVVEETTKEVFTGETVGELPTATREGYGFAGWYTSAEGGTEVSSSQTISGNVTYYAHWYQDKVINYDSNGGIFENEETINSVNYKYQSNGSETRYSHTSNVKDDGTNTSTYASGISKNDIVTIPGATRLKVEVWYSTENNYDWLAIYPKGVTPTSSNYSSATISNGRLTGGTSSTKPSDSSSYHKIYYVDDDTVQFYFYSDGSYNYYGYYAIITDTGGYSAVSGTYSTPTKPLHKFNGWNANSDGSGSSYANESELIQNISNIPTNTTVYAQWERIKAEFDTGQNVNVKFKKLAGNSSATYSTSNNNITSIVKSNVAPNIAEMTSDNIVSSSTSDLPIYAWFDNGTIYWWCDDEYAYFNPTSSYMFYYFTGLTNLDMQYIKADNITNMYAMFNYLSSMTSMDLSNWTTSEITNIGSTFSNSGIINLNISNLDLSQVTTYSGFLGPAVYVTADNVKWNNNSLLIFNGNDKIKRVSLRNGDTSNATSMANMFYSCENVESIDMTGFTTSTITSLYRTFHSCSKLTSLDLSSFDTRAVTNMNETFSTCNAIRRINISSFDTSSVTGMGGMFYANLKLEEIDVSNFNTEKVEIFQYMFYNCPLLTKIDVSNWDISKATQMREMFEYDSGLTELDLSNWDTVKVTDMRNMFNGDSNLTTIYASDKFVTTGVTDSNSSGMFSSCSKLVGGWGTKYNSSYTNRARAIIDSSDTPGYFTAKNGWMLVNRGTIGTPSQHLLEQQWSYYNNGVRVESGFHLLNDLYGVEQKYYFVDGIAHLGWLNYNGDYYYLSTEDDDGNGYVNAAAYRSETKTIDGESYTFDADGKCTNYSGTDFYTVSFDANGGNLFPNTRNVNVSTAIGTLPTPTRNGYTFDGWYTGLTDGVSVDATYVPTNNVVLYARWHKLVDYVISFDANGGNVSIDKRQVKENTSITSLPTPTKTKFSFDGWFTEHTGGTKIETSYVPTSDMTLYAHWREIFTITYDANGGEVSPTSVTVLDGDSMSTLPIPVRDNYTFLGWTTDLTTGILIDTTYIPPTDGTLYAVWQENAKFTVTFDPNNGVLEDNTRLIYVNKPVGSLPEPTREGYGFVGWFTGITDGTQIDKRQIITEDVTYYAHWTIDKTVTFDSNTGSFDEESSRSITYKFRDSNTVRYSHTPNISDDGVQNGNYSNSMSRNDVIAIPYAKGLNIEVWYSTENNCDWLAIYPAGVTPNNSNYTSATISNGRLMGGASTTKPSDSSSYHKTFTVDDDTAQFYFKSDGSVVYYGYYAIITGIIKAYGGNIEYIEPTKTNYSFINWNTKADGTGDSYANEDEIIDDMENLAGKTLYAQWHLLEDYTITFNGNGGTPSEASRVVQELSSIGTLPTMTATKEHYTFDGWYTELVDGTKIDETYVPTGDITLYAHWIPDNYNITYDYNRGNYTFALGEYVDTGYIIDWDKDFTLRQTANIPTLGQRYILFGNYGSATKDLGVEVTASNRIRVWLNGNERSVSSGAIAAGVDIEFVFTWDASENRYTFTATGEGVNATTTGVYDISGSTNYSLRFGTADQRSSNYPYKSLTVKSASITTALPYETGLTNINTVVDSTDDALVYSGYWTSATGGSQVTSSTLVGASDATYYVHWQERPNFTITFNGNGGTPSESSRIVRELRQIGELPTMTTTKEHYTFDGWYTDLTAGTKVTATYVPTGDITLYARWIPDNYNITYNYNRGTYTFANGEYVDTGYIINWDRDFTLREVANIPTLGQRYSIFGNYRTSNTKELTVDVWSTDKLRIWLDGSERSLSTNSIAAGVDIEFVFTWVASTHTYTFTATGSGVNASTTGVYNVSGTASDSLRFGASDHRSGSSPFQSLTVKSATITTSLPYETGLTNINTVVDSTYDAHIFRGYWTSATGGSQVTSSTLVPASDTTYYVHWEERPKYTITFNANGGSVNPSSKDIYVDEKIGGLPTPTKTNYTFTGWYTGLTDGTLVDENYVPTGNDTLYARWVYTMDTCSGNTNVTTLSTNKCTNNENLVVGNGTICKRAIYLHKETCNVTDSSRGCLAAGYSANDTITYGSCGTNGILNVGDAFTCDVNGDGIFDETTERFYYVSDYYNTTTKKFDHKTAALVYYNSTDDGKSCNKVSNTYANLSDIQAVDSSATAIDNGHGPLTVIKDLPTTSQWTNVSLKSTSRAILSEYQSTHDGTTTAAGTLPTAFSYSGKAARLLTVKEAMNACGISQVANGIVHGEVDNCNYLLENTQFANENVYIHATWFETPNYNNSNQSFTVSGNYRYISSSPINSYGSTRPVIDVPKIAMSYGVNDDYTITFNANGGSVSPTTKTIDIGDPIGTLPKPAKREGYNFMGWFTDLTSGTEIDENTVPNGNVTYYAHWILNQDVTTLSTTTCPNNNVTVGSGIVCKRALNLHQEECIQNGYSSYYCLGSGYSVNGSKGTTTITYGSCGTRSSLVTGDAFTCDVNGDGTFDELLERFYYVSDYYNTSTQSFDTSTAALIYYNNVGSGIPSNNKLSAYALPEDIRAVDSSIQDTTYFDSTHGPLTGIKELPTTKQWSNVTLKSNTRSILSGDYMGTLATRYTVYVQSFDYSGYAARLLTNQELREAFGYPQGNTGNIDFTTKGIFDNYNYLMENTIYSTVWNSSGLRTSGFSLENPTRNSNDATSYNSVTYIDPSSRKFSDALANGDPSSSNKYGIRPVIDVPKSSMDY